MHAGAHLPKDKPASKRAKSSSTSEIRVSNYPATATDASHKVAGGSATLPRADYTLTVHCASFQVSQVAKDKMSCWDFFSTWNSGHLRDSCICKCNFVNLQSGAVPSLNFALLGTLE